MPLKIETQPIQFNDVVRVNNNLTITGNVSATGFYYGDGSRLTGITTGGGSGSFSPYTTGTGLSSIVPILGNNTASSYYSNIGGGINNNITNVNGLPAYFSNIGGGANNRINFFTSYSNIGGGNSNIVSHNFSNIGGGTNNIVGSICSVIGGGSSNSISGQSPQSTIAGGNANAINSLQGSIGGGSRNNVSSHNGSIVGGAGNSISSYSIFGSIGGGLNNSISGDYGWIDNNYPKTGSYASVGGGRCNSASGLSTHIGGGALNVANRVHSIVVGGACNTSSGRASVIVGGKRNTASGCYATIINNASEVSPAVGYSFGSGSSYLGYQGADSCLYTDNTCSTYLGYCYFSIAEGPLYCWGYTYRGVIAAGAIASGFSSFIGNGKSACGSCSIWSAIQNCSTNSSYYINSSYTEDGGINVASGDYSSILNGESQCVTGNYSSILGGKNNTVSSAYSFVAGGSANHTRGFINTFLLGTSLSAAAANYTYVNNLSSQGLVVASGGNSGLWNNASNIATAYQNISGSFATNTAVRSTSALLTPLTVTNALTGQLTVNTNTIVRSTSALLTPLTVTNALTGQLALNTTLASTSALLTPLTIYQNASGNWQNVFTSWSNASGTSVVGFNDSRFAKLSSTVYALSGSSIYPIINSNVTAGTGSIIGGGASNINTGSCSTITGGLSNTAIGVFTAVGGGCLNNACGTATTISGGRNNNVRNTGGMIGGGSGNTASGNYSAVVGGLANVATGTRTVVGGGQSNTASGGYSAILGGRNNNTNNQACSFIIGSNITAPLPNYTYVNNLSSLGDANINGNLYVPNRPAFRVYGAGTTNNLGTTVNGNGILNSNNWAVDYQQGSALNGTTGIFTAPIEGLYQVDMVVRTSANNNTGILQAAVVKNVSGSSSVAVMVEFGVNTTMNHAGGSTIIKLAVNETLCLRVLAGAINFDSNDNWSVAFIG